MGAWSVMPAVWPLSQGDATTALTGSGQISRARKNAVHFFVMESLSYVICAVKQAPSAKCAGVRKSIIPHLVRIGKACLEDAGKCRGACFAVRNALEEQRMAT